MLHDAAPSFGRYANACLDGVRRYSHEDNDVAVFGCILRNEVDEEFRYVQKQLKQVRVPLPHASPAACLYPSPPPHATRHVLIPLPPHTTRHVLIPLPSLTPPATCVYPLPVFE